jgi:LPS-assembly protein
MLQTLEPRLYYAEIPYRDQSNFPIFDAGETTFSFSQLFYANRFNGIDRIGDTRQLSTAITTRFIEEESALERLGVSVGEILYFEDRRVQITRTQPSTAPRSNIAAQSTLRLTRTLKARADLLWNPESDMIDKGAFRLQYRDSKNMIVNASYRFNRDSLLRQTDYAFIWPVSPEWRAIGRWQKSRSTHHTLDALGGMEYSTCCWNLRFVDRRVFQPELNKADQRFMIELELKGFTNIGKSVTAAMTETIPGFAHSARPMNQTNQTNQTGQADQTNLTNLTDRTTRMNQ